MNIAKMKEVNACFLAYTGKRPTKEDRDWAEDYYAPDNLSLERELSKRSGFKDSPIYRVHGPHFEELARQFHVAGATADLAIREALVCNRDDLSFVMSLWVGVMCEIGDADVAR